MSDDGTVIKFNQARKAVQKTRREKLAAENRVKFGRTKAQKQNDKALKDKFDQTVDDHKLETDEP